MRHVSAALVAPPRLLSSRRCLERPHRRSNGDEQRWRYDFGEVLQGHARVRTQAPAGSRIIVRYGLTLDAVGELETQPGAEDCFTTSGEDAWLEPCFAVRGFQYVEVQGPDAPGTLVDLQAQEVGTPLETTGSFETDHLLLNQLQQNLVRTVRCCMLDAPMARLSGSARLPLTADASAYLQAAAWQQNAAPIYTKWLVDLLDAQDAQGQLPAVVPCPPDYPDAAAPGRSEALPQLAWVLYRHWGDLRALQQAYPAVRRYVFGTRSLQQRRLRDGFGPGGRDADGTPRALLDTAWFSFGVQLAGRIAGVLGRAGDLALYDKLGRDIAASFQRHFVTPEGRLISQSQTAYTLALGFDLLTAEQRRIALPALADELVASGYHARVAPADVPLLLRLLSRERLLDIAYALVLQTGGESWLSAVLRGATTLWDSSGDRCRLAAVGVGEWLYTHLLGLDLGPDLRPEGNAYKRARMAPQPPLGPAFPEGSPIRSARGALDTVHGRYGLAWEIASDRFTVEARIPANGGATLVLPDGSSRLLTAGVHEVHMPLTPGADEVPTLRDVSGSA
jgi:alpha-L-rhamnosidase